MGGSGRRGAMFCAEANGKDRRSPALKTSVFGGEDCSGERKRLFAVADGHVRMLIAVVRGIIFCNHRRTLCCG